MTADKLILEKDLPMEPADPVARRRDIEEAIAEAERGAKVPHEEVGRWLLSLGTDKPQPMPSSGKK